MFVTGLQLLSHRHACPLRRNVVRPLLFEVAAETVDFHHAGDAPNGVFDGVGDELLHLWRGQSGADRERLCQGLCSCGGIFIGQGCNWKHCGHRCVEVVAGLFAWQFGMVMVAHVLARFFAEIHFVKHNEAKVRRFGFVLLKVFKQCEQLHHILLHCAGKIALDKNIERSIVAVTLFIFARVEFWQLNKRVSRVNYS